MRKFIIILGFSLICLWGIFGTYWAVSSVRNPQEGLHIAQGVMRVVSRPLFLPAIFLFAAILMFTAFAGVLGSAIKYLILQRRVQTRLLAHGQKKTVQIVAIQDTHLTMNNLPYLKLTVKMEHGEEVSFYLFLPRYSALQVGQMIDVLQDPERPDQVMLA